MAEEDKNSVSAQEESSPAQDYIQAINELKKNSVSRDEYDSLVAEKKELLNALVNGQTIEQSPEEDQGLSAKDIRDSFFKDGSEMNNYEFVKTALDLREAVLKETGNDIFVAAGNKLTPTQEDYDKAQKVADVFQQCLDYSNGDSELFTNELMRRTNDVQGAFRKR